MTFLPSPRLWVPQKRGLLNILSSIASGKDCCLQAATGGGKSLVAAEVMRFAMECGKTGAYYINRKLLIPQVIDEFEQAGIDFGVRAAGYEDFERTSAKIQICSAPSEISRAYKKNPLKNTWVKNQADIVVIDETHIQKAATIQRIIETHKAAGAIVVGMTATPVDVHHLYDNIILSGTMQEYRDCKSIVPAVIKACALHELGKVKRSPTGEYVLDGKVKKQFTQTIIGDVYDKWKLWNPDARPTMLFAPGKAESVYFTEEFTKKGVNWCHVDATEAVVDGSRQQLTRSLWEEIKERYVAGDIKGISSRFKLREGVSLPTTYHGILATPIGSLTSYLQICGRILRYSSETPDHVLITDHGGSFFNHGDPNLDYDWKELWKMSMKDASTMRRKSIESGKTKESICCPNCSTERVSGFECPSCGHKHEKSSRTVIQADGSFKTVTGNLIKQKTQKDWRAKRWESMFWAWRKSYANRTMYQMYGYFCSKFGGPPPEGTRYLPKNEKSWHKYPCDVNFSDLT